MFALPGRCWLLCPRWYYSGWIGSFTRFLVSLLCWNFTVNMLLLVFYLVCTFFINTFFLQHTTGDQIPCLQRSPRVLLGLRVQRGLKLPWRNEPVAHWLKVQTDRNVQTWLLQNQKNSAWTGTTGLFASFARMVGYRKAMVAFNARVVHKYHLYLWHFLSHAL